MGSFEEIEHTADYALLIRGRDLRDLLQAALDGFVALVIGKDRPAPGRWEQYEIDAEDAPTLVMRAVRELLYRLEEGEMPVSAEVLKLQEDPPRVRVRVGLAPLQSGRRQLQRVVKAVTYHDLVLRQDKSGLSLILTFDT